MTPKRGTKLYITADGDTLNEIIRGLDANPNKLLEQNNMVVEEKPEETNNVDPSFDAYNVVKNEDYGSERIMKMANNTSVKTIIISICLGIMILAAIIVLVIILKG